MPSDLYLAIVKTISYSDIFDYPLTGAEIGKWLIKFRIKNLEFRIKNIKIISYKDEYYFLNKRENIVKTRKERKKWSEEKIKKLEKLLPLFKFIPSIRLVGITGALAMDNAKKEDDIDLMIITGNKRIWTTRLILTLLLDILGVRRRPDEIEVDDNICLNMYLDEAHLAVPQTERDLFSAHEVLQLKPILERDGTYSRFIKANEWAKEYLPNAFPVVSNQSRVVSNNLTDSLLHCYTRLQRYVLHCGQVVQFFNWMELILRNLQLRYMRSKRTTEIVGEGIIRFHPRDARGRVMKEYKKRLAIYHL